MTLTTVNLSHKTYIPFALMYVFAEGSPINREQIVSRFLSFILSGIILSSIYYIRHKKLESERTIKDIFNSISISKETTVFNIKMTLGLTVAFFLTKFFGIEKGMWISMTVMSLTQPNFHLIKKRIQHRFFGTVVGGIFFLILFGGLIPEKFFGVITAILSYIYTFAKSYYIQIIFVTINALNAANGIFDTLYHGYIYRLSFIFIGIVIVLIIVFLEKMLDKKVESDKNDENDVLTNND
ncbi:FUSC family protein [[Clostridium] colinum]|uniref:FUSC family protein n=1 Tax=[Clostridium] colinum TaxID=36835 RepID=UPI00202456E1|nr:FUSC family protein [[Clostridium] colinum]